MELSEQILLSIKGDYSDLIKQSTAAKQSADELKKSLAEQRHELALLEAAGKGNSKQYQEVSREVKANEEAVKALNKVQQQASTQIQAGVKLNQAQKGSIAELRAENVLLANTYVKLSEAERNNKDVGVKQLAQLREHTDKLKALESAYGDNRRNVGNYKDAISGLTDKLKDHITSNDTVSKGYAALSKVIGTTVGAFKSAGTAIKSVSQELAAERAARIAAQDAARAHSAAVAAGAEAEVIAAAATVAETTALEAQTLAAGSGTAAMKILKVALASTGIGFLIVAVASLVAYFEKTNEGAKKFKAIMAGVNAAIDEGLKVLGSYGKLMYDIFTLNTKDLAEDFKKLSSNVMGFAGNVVEATKAGKALAEERFKLVKAEREWSTERIKQQKEVDLLTMKIRQQTLSEEERIKLAEEAKIKRKAIFDEDLKHAEENLKLVEKEQALKSKKDYQSITEAKNHVEQMKATYETDLQNIQNRESRVQKMQMRGAKSRSNDLIDIQMQASEDQQKLWDKESKSLIDSREKAYKTAKQISDTYYAQKKVDLVNELKNEKITQEQFDIKDLQLLRGHGAAGIEIEKSFYKSSTDLELKQADLTLKIREKEIDDERKIAKDRIKLGQDTGRAIGMLIGQSVDEAGFNMEKFSKAILLMAVDTLEKIALTAAAKATIESMATAQSVATFGISGALQGAALSAIIVGIAEAVKGTINAAAGGGEFMTNGPTMIMVGDNPGGVERVSVTPISGMGTTTVNPATGLVKMAGGGTLTADGGYASRNMTNGQIDYDKIAEAMSKQQVIAKITDINNIQNAGSRTVYISSLN